MVRDGADRQRPCASRLATASRSRRSASPTRRAHHQGQQTEHKEGKEEQRGKGQRGGDTRGQQRRSDCDNVHRQQCAATGASLPSRPPPPQPSVRTIRPPELTPNRGHMHGGATGSIPHAERACGATGSGRLEGWLTASKRRVWGCQGALCAKKVGSAHVGLAGTISMPVQTSGQSFRTSRSRKGLMNYCGAQK